MKRLVGFLFFYIIISMLFGCFFDNSSDEQKASENGFDIEGFTKIETYQKLTQEDVDLLTSSQIIYANLSNWVSLAINEKSNELEIEIPSYVKWDNAYDEDGNLTKTGELWNLVQVLNIEAFQTGGTFDINKLVDINSISKLTERDSTIITTSKIILMNIDKIINKCFIEKNDLSLSIPKGIIWENSVTADGTIERAGEFLNIVNVLKIKAFNDENGFNVDKFDINGFKELTKEDTNVLLD